MHNLSLSAHFMCFPASQLSIASKKRQRDMSSLTDSQLFIEKARVAIKAAVDAAYHDGSGGDSSTAVGHWCRFTIIGRKLQAFRVVDPNASLELKLREEELIMEFAYWLIKELNVRVDTAESYIGTVNGWHSRRKGVSLAGNLKCYRLNAMLKGMREMASLLPPPLSKKRFGVRAKWLRQAIDLAAAQLEKSARIQGYAQEAISAIKERANMEACAECAQAGLLRGGEVTAKEFNQYRDVSRKNVRFVQSRVVNGAIQDQFTLIYTRNSKAKGKGRAKKLAVFLPSGGKFLDPDKAIRRLFEIDPVPKSEWATTPLFRHPESNKAIAVAELRIQIQIWMGSIGLNPKNYGAHSLRIGGATAIFAASQKDPECGSESDVTLTIKTLGRWCSEAYLLYVRANRSKAYAAAKAACSYDVSDFDQEFVAVDNDLLFEDIDDPDDSIWM